MSVKKCLIISVFLFISIFSAQCYEPIYEKEIDLTVFNSSAFDRFEEQYNTLQPHKYQEFIGRLGKIAFFIRLVRRFSQSPNVGPVDFERYFPKPELPFHQKLYEMCVRSTTNPKPDIIRCVNYIFQFVIQPRAKFLFPTIGQQMDDFHISGEEFNRLVSNNNFQFDVSVAYLFCFFAKNKLEFMRRLPFCTYANSEPSKNIWPADMYKEQKDRLEQSFKVREQLETLDEFNSYSDFQCAEQSFCPNPCCGFDLSSKCSHPICKNASPDMTCSLKQELNSDLLGMIANMWNISCNCPSTGYVYRFDTEQCVDSDECSLMATTKNNEEEERCSADKHEECVNMAGSFKCVCQMGFVRNSADECVPIQLKPFIYNGPATGFSSNS